MSLFRNTKACNCSFSLCRSVANNVINHGEIFVNATRRSEFLKGNQDFASNSPRGHFNEAIR